MIHVVDEKHLNDFKEVRCIKVRDLWSRLGSRVPNTNFECSEEPIPMNQSKIDAMQSIMSEYDKYMQEQVQRESAGADAQPQGEDEPND